MTKQSPEQERASAEFIRLVVRRYIRRTVQGLAMPLVTIVLAFSIGYWAAKAFK